MATIREDIFVTLSSRERNKYGDKTISIEFINDSFNESSVNENFVDTGNVHVMLLS